MTKSSNRGLKLFECQKKKWYFLKIEKLQIHCIHTQTLTGEARGDNSPPEKYWKENAALDYD